MKAVRSKALRLRIYLIVIFLITYFSSWFQETTLFVFGSINICAFDFVILLLLLVAVRALLSKGVRSINKNNPLYMFFLLWLGLEILYGSTKFGFSAFGEARLIGGFLSYFVPFYLLNENQRNNTLCIMKIIYQTVYCSAISGLLLYIFNMLLSRPVSSGEIVGARYIASTQTFYITILFCFFAFKHRFLKELSVRENLLMMLSIVLAIFSKNRSGFIFPIATTIFVYAKYFKARMIMPIIVLFVLSSLVIVAIAMFSASPIFSSTIYTAFYGALDPTNDATGQWRLGVQLSALKQAVESFWFGQGYGGYYSIVVPGMNWGIPYEVPPHNQYLSIFMKTGIIGVSLLVLLIFNHCYKSLVVLKKYKCKANETIYILLLLVIVGSQVLYGMTYDFIPLFGLYYGLGVLLLHSIRNTNTSIVNSHRYCIRT